MQQNIVLIGGGIVGSAAAYFLAKSGRAGNIAVIEPDPTYQLASTPQSAGGVRRLFSTPENIELSKFSLDFYQSFAERIDAGNDLVDIGFKQQGYLFVVDKDGAKTLERNHALQVKHGVPVDLLDRAELTSRFPSIATDDVALATHSDSDGWIDPHAALQGFRKRAEQLGVTYIARRVTSINAQGTAVTSVSLDDGSVINADYFINTAGPWCAEVAAMLSAQIPVQPMCRIQHFWHCASEIENLPLVKDESGLFFRPEGDGFAGGRPTFDIAPGFNFDIDRGTFANYFEETVWPLLAKRLPHFESIRLERTWGGHYAQNTFDGNMIIGKFSRDHGNIITACGFSGHGLMHAPAVGRALSELALDGGYSSIDLSALTMERVWQDSPYPEVGIV